MPMPLEGPCVMRFGFGDRVRLLDTPHNRQGGKVGETGTVVGISPEDEDSGEHAGYAVTLHGGGLTHFVPPDGLASEGG